MGTVLLLYLEKVGWVVLKYDYDITANGKEHNYLYQLNNHNFKPRQCRWNKIHNKNRQMFYNINKNKNKERFVEDLYIRHNINYF